MPHSKTDNDYDLIVGYLGAMPDMPADERGKIESWILAHSDDGRLDDSMARVWASEDVASTPASMLQPGFWRLLNDVERMGPQAAAAKEDDTPRRRGWLWKSCAALVGVIVLAGAYWFGISSGGADTMLVTADWSVGEYVLPDGSHVWLNGGSKLSYGPDFTTGLRRRVKIEGEGYFSVASNKLRPFVVDMDGMEVEVTGTEFVVRNYADCPTHDVVLRSGSVKVRGPWGKDVVTMKPDQILAYGRDTGKMNVSTTDAATYCRWFEPTSDFDNTPLADILINISRRHGLDLKIDAAVDTSFSLSVTMGGESVEDIMDVVKWLSPISYRIDNNTLYISADN